MWHCGSLLVIIVTLALVANASSFTPVPVTKSIGGICNYGLKSALSDGDGQQSSPRQKQQETRMERASIAGADEIRKLDVNARTKRAMLAEAVEGKQQLYTLCYVKICLMCVCMLKTFSNSLICCPLI